MTWAVLQSASAAPSSTSAATATATFSSNLSAGSKIIAFFGLGTQPSVTSVQDTAGNPLTQLGLLHSQSQTIAAYAMDTPAGDVGVTTAITVTLGTAAHCALVIAEVSGLLLDNTTAMLDDPMVTAGFTGGSASDAQPAYTTFGAGEFLVAFQTGFAGQTTTEPGGYTADANGVEGNTWLNCVPAYASSSGGAESGTWTTSGTTQPSLIGVLAFNPAAAPAVPIYAQNVDPPPRPPGWFPGVPGVPMGEPFQVWPPPSPAETPVPGVPTYDSLVATDGPVAWWKLGEPSGTNCADSSGGAHPVTLGGSGGVLGNVNAPAGIPGTTLAVTAATTANSTYTPPLLAGITAEIWFNQNGQANTSDARIMADDATSGSSFQLVLHTSGGSFPACIFSVAGTFVFPTSAVAAPATGWVHLVATFGGNVVHLYQNGVEVAGTGTALTGPLPAPTNPVCLGGNDPWINAPFLGLLSRAAVYDKVLTPAQVLAHYTAGITAPPVVMPVLQPYRPATAPQWFPGAPGVPLGIPFQQWPVPSDPGAAPVTAAAGTAAIAGAGTTAAVVTQDAGTLSSAAGAGAVTAAAAVIAGATAAAAAAGAAKATQIAPATAAAAGAVTAVPAVQAATGSAAGAGATTAVVTQIVTGSAAGAGSVTAVATVIAGAAAAAAGAVTDVVTQIAGASAAGAGSVTAAGSSSGAATATAAGAGSVTAIVTQIAPAASAAGASVTAVTTQAAGAAAAGAGTVTDVATQIAPASSAGAAAVTDVVTQIAAAAAAGAGSVTAAGSSSGAAGAAAAGAAAVTTVVTQAALATAAAAAAVADTATQAAKATATGAGSVTAAGQITGTASAAGAGAATAKAVQAATAPAAAAGVLSALATQQATAIITGAGTAAATGNIQLAFTVGTLTAATAAAAALTGATTPGATAGGTLTATTTTTGGPS